MISQGLCDIIRLSRDQVGAFQDKAFPDPILDAIEA